MSAEQRPDAKRRAMYERSSIPVTKSIEQQSWRDIKTSGGKGLDSVTLYRGFYVEIDSSADVPFIWLGINTGFDSVTYWYEEYPRDAPLSLVKTEGLMKVDRFNRRTQVEVGMATDRTCGGAGQKHRPGGRNRLRK